MLLDLVGALGDPDNAGREILFVGFGETTTGSEAAISASVAASADVQAALEALGWEVRDGADGQKLKKI